MTDHDLPAFLDLMRKVQRIFPLRGDAREIEQVQGAYFQALKRWPLHLVELGAEGCIEKGKYFPKPADWIHAIPPRSQAQDIPAMSHDEATTYRAAEALRYEGDPCHCPQCVQACVDHKPMRFVPEFDSFDRDRKVRDPLTDRIVTAGHWCHGLELAELYARRADFWEAMYKNPEFARHLKGTFKGKAT